jgi:hypothetical protein
VRNEIASFLKGVEQPRAAFATPILRLLTIALL